MSTVVTNEEMRNIISRNLCRILKRLGWTQSELSEALFGSTDVKHRMQISRWCKATVTPSSTDIANLAEVLGVTVADLMRSPQTKKIV